MKIIDVKKASNHLNPHGVSVHKLYDTEHAQIMHMELKPGESLKKHTTPTNVCFYILEGEGIVEIGEERELVSKDMLIESPVKIPHRLMNEGTENFRFLVIKAPRQKEPTTML
ncbi:MAG: cupin domain-containing protein [Methanomethylovorans sp.]|jgi:mannose-6-phosphate isomerase-like protein (cupin superfamily)|nr:cupin domain-containing protein [Methanomethylovorans sp.]